MRVLMKVQMPVESGNEAIRNGKLPQIIAQTLETVKAEAAYVTTMDGKRTMLVVFDLKAVSDMLRIADRRHAVDPLLLERRADQIRALAQVRLAKWL